MNAVKNVEFNPIQDYYLSSEPEYILMFKKRSGRSLNVTFNTGKVTFSEESGEPVQIHYSYTFEPNIESFKLLADLCEDAVTEGSIGVEHYMWTQDTVFKLNNPDYLKIPYTDVDCVNLIDRESRTCLKLNDKLAKHVVMAINMVYPLKTNVKPDFKNLQLLQIRYKDGKKAEYWMHNNVFMYKNIQLGGVDRDWHTGVSDLYFSMGLPNSWEMQSGEWGPLRAEWLGMMNSYCITKVKIGEGKELRKDSSSTFSATAGKEHRQTIIDIAKKLQSILVDPRTVTKGNKSKILSTSDEPQLNIFLEFENGKEQYQIYLFKDGRIKLSVGSIQYYLAYKADDEDYQDILNILHNYCALPKNNPTTEPK